MATYDESVIQAAADALYARAASIVMSYTIIGVIVGAIVGVFLASGSSLGGVAWIGGAVIGGYIGWWQAQGAAFMLRLQAQTALCQVQIEKNTRTVSQPRMTSTSAASSIAAKPLSPPRLAALPTAAADVLPVQKPTARWWR